MKAFKRSHLIIAFIIGIATGHLLGPHDPLPLHTAMEDAEKEASQYFENHNTLPSKLRGFTPTSGSKLKHNHFDLIYDYKEGSLSFNEPWLYNGFIVSSFLRRLSSGIFGMEASKNGGTRYVISKSLIEELNQE